MKPVPNWISYLLLVLGIIAIVWSASTHIVEGDKAAAVDEKQEQLQCLAKNIYHESRGEPVVGQVAVGYVTWERAEQSIEKLCNVVFKPYQFSWTTSATDVSDSEAFAAAMKVANDVVSGKAKNPVPKATHYHSMSVKPSWRKGVMKVAKIGNHIFYQPKSKA